MSYEPWDRTEEDSARAFAASARVARQHGLPESLLRHCCIDPPESASDMIQDGSILGIDFTQSSENRKVLTLRMIGPYWDRWMLLRFIDVVHFDAERPDLFNISELHWLEFFHPEVGAEPLPAYVDELPEDAFGCHFYTLSLRTRYSVVARRIEFTSRVIPRQKKLDDFRIADDGEWVVR